jgi:hypothetical protein
MSAAAKLLVAGWNPADGVDVCRLRLHCALGSGLCKGLITLSEEFYRV